MGKRKKNFIAGPHCEISGTWDGYRISVDQKELPAIHSPSPLVTTGAAWETLISAAQTSQAAFDTAAAAEWGAWYIGQAQSDKASCREAMSPLPAVGWPDP